MIYTHVVKDMRNPATSPLDMLGRNAECGKERSEGGQKKHLTLTTQHSIQVREFRLSLCVLSDLLFQGFPEHEGR